MLVFKPSVRADGGEEHEHEGDGVTQVPVQFGHEAEVHAVDGCDERGRQEYHRHDREEFDDAVLLNVNQPE